MTAFATAPARTRPSRRSGAIAAACVLLTAVAALLVLGMASHSATRAQADARAAARSFLARYVNPNGRVVRRDQGGDTVSEGQAYGLLLSQVAGDQESKETFIRTLIEQGVPVSECYPPNAATLEKYEAWKKSH